jgi:transposase-like protein
METISVVAEVQRRRRFSIRDKLIAVQESNEPGMTVSYVARKYGVSPSLLFNWRRRMAQGGKQAIEADDDVVAVGAHMFTRALWPVIALMGHAGSSRMCWSWVIAPK